MKVTSGVIMSVETDYDATRMLPRTDKHYHDHKIRIRSKRTVYRPERGIYQMVRS